MFSKSIILFAACLSIVLAVPEPKPEAKADHLVVSTYNAGLPVVNAYSGSPIVNTYSGYPVHTYSAAHAVPLHARTYSVHHAGVRTVAIDSPVVRTVAADVPVAISAVNPLHYTAVSSPVAAAYVV